MTTLTLAPLLDCEGCGRRPRFDQDHDRCIPCERLFLECEAYAAETTLQVLRAAIRNALTRVAVEDVHGMVRDAVRCDGCDGAATISTLLEQARELASQEGQVPA
jgi:predicted molibdopterin-dependent oxidoreductase YjgC